MNGREEGVCELSVTVDFGVLVFASGLRSDMEALARLTRLAQRVSGSLVVGQFLAGDSVYVVRVSLEWTGEASAMQMLAVLHAFVGPVFVRGTVLRFRPHDLIIRESSRFGLDRV